MACRDAGGHRRHGKAGQRPKRSTSTRPNAKARWSGTPPRRSSRRRSLPSCSRTKPPSRSSCFVPAARAVLRRFLQEREGGRVAADVLSTADPAASASLAKKGMFIAFKPKNFEKIAGHRQGCGRLLRRLPAQHGHVLRAHRQSRGGRRAEDLVGPRGSQIPRQDDLDRSVVHLLAGDGRGHARAPQGLDLLRRLAAQRDHGRAGQPAGGRHAQARRAADRRRRARQLRGRRPPRRPSDRQYFPGRRHFRGAGTERHRRRRAQSQCGKTVRRVPDRRHARKNSSSPTAPIRRASDLPAPERSPPLKQIKLLPVDYEQIEKEASAIKKKFNEVFH